jgi:hypothetical protein
MRTRVLRATRLARIKGGEFGRDTADEVPKSILLDGLYGLDGPCHVWVILEVCFRMKPVARPDNGRFGQKT